VLTDSTFIEGTVLGEDVPALVGLIADLVGTRVSPPTTWRA